MLYEFAVLAEDKENRFTTMPSRTRAAETSPKTFRWTLGDVISQLSRLTDWTGKSVKGLSKYGNSCTPASPRIVQASDHLRTLPGSFHWRYLVTGILFSQSTPRRCLHFPLHAHHCTLLRYLSFCPGFDRYHSHLNSSSYRGCFMDQGSSSSAERRL